MCLQSTSEHIQGQEKLVSVNVVLVLNLHFNFISEDSNKRYSFADQMAIGWRVNVRISVIQLESICSTEHFE